MLSACTILIHIQARPNSVCVFIPSEITSACYYPGVEKNRMVANVIFRMGGAAIMLSNKPSLRARSKYELVAASRVHEGANDEAYG
jgi:3-ketoacyl-CoA synthase